MYALPTQEVKDVPCVTKYKHNMGDFQRRRVAFYFNATLSATWVLDSKQIPFAEDQHEAIACSLRPFDRTTICFVSS